MDKSISHLRVLHEDHLGDYDGDETGGDGGDVGGLRTAGWFDQAGSGAETETRPHIAQITVTETIFLRLGVPIFTPLGAVTVHGFILLWKLAEVRAAPLVDVSTDAPEFTEVLAGIAPLHSLTGTFRDFFFAAGARALENIKNYSGTAEEIRDTYFQTLVTLPRLGQSN